MAHGHILSIMLHLFLLKIELRFTGIPVECIPAVLQMITIYIH